MPKNGIEHCKTIEQLVEKSDAIMVLAPDNCEQKEKLSHLALQSGKPCFVDKPFGTDLASAKRMFDLRKNTIRRATVALRFAMPRNIKRLTVRLFSHSLYLRRKILTIITFFTH